MKMINFFPDDFDSVDAENYMLKYFKAATLEIFNQYVNFTVTMNVYSRDLLSKDTGEKKVATEKINAAAFAYKLYADKFPISMQNMLDEFHDKYCSDDPKSNSNCTYSVASDAYKIICNLITEIGAVVTDDNDRFDNLFKFTQNRSHSDLNNEITERLEKYYPKIVTDLHKCHFLV